MWPVLADPLAVLGIWMRPSELELAERPESRRSSGRRKSSRRKLTLPMTACPRTMTAICFVCNLPILSHQVGLVWQGGNGWDDLVREQLEESTLRQRWVSNPPKCSSGNEWARRNDKGRGSNTNHTKWGPQHRVLFVQVIYYIRWILRRLTTGATARSSILITLYFCDTRS